MESKEKHTPGPWKVARRFDIYQDIQVPGAGGTLVASTRGNRQLSESVNSRCEADAKLIAAAPDLLAACEAVELWLLAGQPWPFSDQKVLEVVGDAISKAVGRAEK